MTVSKALRDKKDVSAATKARIKALAQQLGYVPDSSAKMLRTRSSKLFGLVIPSVTHPIQSRVMLAIEDRAYHLGYDILVSCTMNDPEREEAVIRRLIARRVEGLFVAPVYRLATEARIYKELATLGVPTVLLGHSAPFCAGFANVACDDLKAGQLVTSHLLKLGHRRIAFVSGPPGTPWSALRFEGYRSALREHGLEVDDKLVFQGGRTIEHGHETAAQLLSESPDATAIQATNDFLAVGCAETLMAKGYDIPGSISVTGFGNTLISEHFRVPLTTVGEPKYRLGLAAMESMIRLVGATRAETRRLPGELTVRASSGTPPASPALGRHKAASTAEKAV